MFWLMANYHAEDLINFFFYDPLNNSKKLSVIWTERMITNKPINFFFFLKQKLVEFSEIIQMDVIDENYR